MSHKSTEQFYESLREARAEKVYEACIPDRCYTSFDPKDKAELDWRTEHCWNTVKQEKPFKHVILPSNEDEDYWREREEVSRHLQEVYAEAQRYRDL